MANPWVSCCRPGYDGHRSGDDYVCIHVFRPRPDDAAGFADLQLIRYDSYADDGEMIYGGYFSDAATGFGKNNLWVRSTLSTKSSTPPSSRDSISSGPERARVSPKKP